MSKGSSPSSPCWHELAKQFSRRRRGGRHYRPPLSQLQFGGLGPLVDAAVRLGAAVIGVSALPDEPWERGFRRLSTPPIDGHYHVEIDRRRTLLMGFSRDALVVQARVRYPGGSVRLVPCRKVH